MGRNRLGVHLGLLLGAAMLGRCTNNVGIDDLALPHVEVVLLNLALGIIEGQVLNLRAPDPVEKLEGVAIRDMVRIFSVYFWASLLAPPIV